MEAEARARRARDTAKFRLSGLCGKHPAIAKSLNFSHDALERLSSMLTDRLGRPDEHSPFIATCGSLARFEASSLSDIDRMVVYPEAERSDSSEFMRAVDAALGSVEFGKNDKRALMQPNPKGVFKAPADAQKLLQSIGSFDETYDDLSRRMLLILESHPLWHESSFFEHRDRLVGEYSKDVIRDPSKHYVLLLNDLIRYFRTICVNYHAQKNDEYGKWPVRNVKLRHSRVLMYISLLFVLGELSKPSYTPPHADPGDKFQELMRLIELPPLERLVQVYEANNDDNLDRALGLYNLFLQKFRNEDTRIELHALEYEGRYENDAFAALKANSDAFSAEMMRFYNERRSRWSDRFFEYVLL